MSESEPTNRSDDEQIRRVIDRLVDAEEFSAFNERLRNDSAFRERYICHADLEASLHEEFSGLKQYLTPQAEGTQRRSLKKHWFLWSVTCIALALIVAAVCLNREFRPAPHQQSVVETGLGNAEPLSVAAPVVVFDANDSKKPQDAAVIVRVDGVSRSDLMVGQRLSSGVLRLGEGQIQLEFMSGAILALAAPAELRLESRDAATLVSGVASMRVPDRARGFILNAPDTAVVDLGTEFGVRIDESGTSEVEVTSGEVQLSLLGDDGNTLISQLVTEAESFRVDGQARQLVSVPRSHVNLPRITTAGVEPLPVTEAYVNAVLTETPVLYWRFEGTQNGLIRNEVNERWSAAIHRPETSPECIRIDNGSVRFERADSPRYLKTDQQISAINEDTYSIEFWMKPDDLHRSTCVGLFPDDRAYIHLNVVEIATDTELVHAPGAFVFYIETHQQKRWNSEQTSTPVASAFRDNGNMLSP